MSPRALVNGAIASVLLWAVILGAGYGIAHAAEGPASPVLQATVDETGAWLAATLHAEVEQVPVVVSTDLRPEWAGEFSPATQTAPAAIRLRPGYAAAFLNPSRADLRGPTIVLHEKLHRRATAACWRPTEPGGVNVEEGVVQSVASDLMPAWGWRFWHVRALHPYVMYPADVAAIRAASVQASGSASWRERAARLWRRALWAASCDGRAAMLESVGT